MVPYCEKQLLRSKNMDVIGKSIERRLVSIEILSEVDHPEVPRPGPKGWSTLKVPLKLFERGGPTLMINQHYIGADSGTMT